MSSSIKALFLSANVLLDAAPTLDTSAGMFYWVLISRIETIVFHRPRDLVSRDADVSVSDDPDRTMYRPALYADIKSPATDGFRLGRETSWADTLSVRASGQHMFLCGNEAVGIMDLTELHFRP